jgi:hypothetical protein
LNCVRRASALLRQQFYLAAMTKDRLSLLISCWICRCRKNGMAQ